MVPGAVDSEVSASRPEQQSLMISPKPSQPMPFRVKDKVRA